MDSLKAALTYMFILKFDNEGTEKSHTYLNLTMVADKWRR